MPLALAREKGLVTPVLTPQESPRGPHLAADAASTAAGLVPALYDRERVESPRLSDDGFCDSLATIQLSSRLSMALVLHSKQQSHHLSQRGLDELGLTAHAAWTLAAANLQKRALTPNGLRFWTRPATHSLPGCPGVEVRVLGAPISAWLAHPQTFSTLDSHLRRVLRCDRLMYLVPYSARVLVLRAPTAESARLWAHRSTQLCPAHSPLISAHPLVLSNGFPQEIT